MESPPPGNLHEAVTWWDDLPATRGRGLIWSRPAGLAIGLLGVVLLTLPLVLTDQPFGTLFSPSLIYLPLIAGVAYGWGGRVGAATALAAFLASWFVFIPPRYSFALPDSGEWVGAILIAARYIVFVILGDAVRRLRRATQRLETIIASIADGILVVDQRGDLLHTNEAMRQLLGTDVPHTVADRNALWQTRTTSGTPLEPGTGPTTRALRGLTSTRTELLIRDAVGRDLTVSVSGAPLRGRGGRILGAVIVCRDVTGLRRLQQAKDDFLSVASHELKTPLTALGGYAQLLRQRLSRIDVDDERALRYLVALETQARRMGELVNTLLDVSRLDAGRLQLRRAPCDIAALVRETADQLGDLSTQHPIAVEAPASLVGAWDADRVEQVVVNLLTNAIRYTPNGGTITLTVGTTSELRPETTPPEALATPAAYVSLRDQGLGIPPDQLDAIFDRFHRTHAADVTAADARHGMGLGLYISREIVERHSGQIWATSPGLGHGSTFTFTLPLPLPPTEPTPSTNAQTPATQVASGR